jgi:hypothetical protein
MLRLKLFLNNLKRFLKNLLPDSFNKLEPEVIECYSNKLPNSIQVKWFRDGRFIVGEVEAGKYKFMTQGRNAKEFISMVNDALLAVCEVPEDYVEFFLKNNRYTPDSIQMSQLADKSIRRADFGIKKMELAHN